MSGPAGDAGRGRGPIVYSCSGSSNVAQLANAVAVRIDRLGLAEMSCIAGVGGGVKALVRTAQSGRPIVAIDGCPLGCCQASLAARGVQPDHLVRLHERGLRKRRHTDFDPEETEAHVGEIVAELRSVLADLAGSGAAVSAAADRPGRAQAVPAGHRTGR